MAQIINRNNKSIAATIHCKHLIYSWQILLRKVAQLSGEAFHFVTKQIDDLVLLIQKFDFLLQFLNVRLQILDNIVNHAIEAGETGWKFPKMENKVKN